MNEEDVIKASAKESAGLEDRQLAEALARFVLKKYSILHLFHPKICLVIWRLEAIEKQH